MSLTKYKSKRDLKSTPEPNAIVKHGKNALFFCVQKHAASHLHYDFRLEYNGILLSWAIPKGPSLDPKVKRLAMQVEDHPFDYGEFEGTIPKGNYGAGTVLLWDKGYFTVSHSEDKKEAEKNIKKGLAKGELEFVLHGKKLQGRFVLVKLKNAKEDNSWLIIKKNDEFASQEDVALLENSVKTSRSMEEISQGVAYKKPKAQKIPQISQPMLATLIDAPFNDKDWIFEIKWDGYRTIAYVQEGNANLESRAKNSFNSKFAAISEILSHLEEQVILDGEVVVLDAEGKPSFQLMQNYQENREGILCYYVFDLLYQNGEDLRARSLLERKALLELIIKKIHSPYVLLSEYIPEKGISLFKAASKNGLEGIIGKRISSDYQPRRSHDWVKIKSLHRQEVVIGGFTAPRGNREKFGALLVGVYKGDEFIYAGHIGGGFDASLLTSVYAAMKPLIQKKCPFKLAPKPNAAPTWIQPKLVCEVSFAEWTKDNVMRQPIFQGLRIDKPAQEVKKEIAEISPKKTKQSKVPQDLITHPDKIYWPEEKYTKGNLIHYYEKMAPYILPYLKNRPIVLNRFPNGIEGESFFQKEIMPNHPDWIKTVAIPHEERTIHYLLIDDLPSLLYAVNLGSIEINPFTAKSDHLDNPDYCIIDLDPEDIPFEKVIETALVTHDILKMIGMKHYCKTSGGRGMHIILPLKAKYTFDQSRQFAEIIAMCVHQKIPGITSLERSPKKRQKKVYLDYLQNRIAQTIVAPYSVRPRPHALVSAPLDWSEVKKGLDPKNFTMMNMPERAKEKGDLFKPILGPGINIELGLKRLQKHFKTLNPGF